MSGANNNPLKLKLERSNIPGSLFYTHYCCTDTQLSSTLLSISSVQRLLPSASPGCRAAPQIHTQKVSQGSSQWTELLVPTRQGSDLVMFGCGSEQKILADNGLGQNMCASYIKVTLCTWHKLLKITHRWLLASHMTQRVVFWGKVWVCLTRPPTQTSSLCGLGHSYVTWILFFVKMKRCFSKAENPTLKEFTCDALEKNQLVTVSLPLSLQIITPRPLASTYLYN